MHITIKDIANVAGVSYSTVSKALNNSPLVKPDTKNKIVEIANKMGYKPNFAAQKLVSKQTKIIGLIWPTVDRVVLSTLVTKISSEMNKTAYSMILSIDPLQTALDTFKKFQVDGIILFEENPDTPFGSNSIPLLSYGVAGNNKDPYGYSIIDANHERAMSDAIKYLYNLGHTRITFIGDFSTSDPMQREKYNGYKKAMKKYNLSVKDHNLINTEGLNWYDGYKAAKKHLSYVNKRPTAIVGGSYDISGGIIRAIKESNLSIPQDISIISYDNIPQMANLEVPLTCIGVPVDQLANEIVSTIIQIVESNEVNPSIKKMIPVLHERDSSAAIK